MHQRIGWDVFYRKCSIHDYELAALVFALKVLKPYLYQVPYKIYIIHPFMLKSYLQLCV